MKNIKRICYTCKKPFYIYPSTAKRSKARFCSRKCFSEFQKGKITFSKEIKCIRCEKIFIAISNKQRFCKKCGRIHKIEYSKIQGRKYRMSPEGIYSGIVSNCKKRKIGVSISKTNFKKWYNAQEKNCVYCGIPENRIKDLKIKKSRLEIDRKDSNKGYIEKNLALACPICNLAKSDFFTPKEMLKIGRIIKEIINQRNN